MDINVISSKPLSMRKATKKITEFLSSQETQSNEVMVDETGELINTSDLHRVRLAPHVQQQLHAIVNDIQQQQMQNGEQ